MLCILTSRSEVMCLYVSKKRVNLYLMSIQIETSGAYLRALFNLYLFMAGIVIVPTLVSSVKFLLNPVRFISGGDWFMVIIMGLSVAGALAMEFQMVRPLMQEARHAGSLREKLSAYRGAFMLRCAFISSIGATSAALMFMSDMAVMLVFMILASVAILLMWPTTGRIATQLRLTNGEKAILEDPSEILG